MPDFMTLVQDELHQLRRKHAPLNSAHEAVSIIAEELLEFWEQVRMKRELRSPDVMLRELVQTAAMCASAAIDLNLITS